MRPVFLARAGRDKPIAAKLADTTKTLSPLRAPNFGPMSAPLSPNANRLPNRAKGGFNSRIRLMGDASREASTCADCQVFEVSLSRSSPPFVAGQRLPIP